MEKPSKPIPESQWHPWMRAALKLGQQNQSWFLVEPGTEQYQAWTRYFQTLGWIPMMVQETKPVTMPVEWPQWLPTGWDPLMLNPQREEAAE